MCEDKASGRHAFVGIGEPTDQTGSVWTRPCRKFALSHEYVRRDCGGALALALLFGRLREASTRHL